MDHSQALEQMAAERYLLNELPPEAREAFEEHVFDCHECAMDIRAAAVFVDEAKAQLPALTQPVPSPPSASPAKPRLKRDRWFDWLRPAFAVPVFATLLLVLGYQNLVTFPALRMEANEPRLLPSAPLRGATRGGSGLTITADRKRGVALPLEISQESGVAPATSYSFDLLDSQGKKVWTGVIAAPPGDGGDQRITLAIPGAMLQNGSYTVAVSSIGPQGQHTPIERYVFAIRFID
jgi:hypothetical protein